MKTVLLHAHTHIHTTYSLMDYTINKWVFFMEQIVYKFNSVKAGQGETYSKLFLKKYKQCVAKLRKSE